MERPRKGLLEVSVNECDGDCVVAAVGELDLSTVELLEAALEEAEAGAASQILLDLSQLSFIDSSGLHMILKAHARSDADSNRLRIRRGPRRVQRVFELTGTDSRLPFID